MKRGQIAEAVRCADAVGRYFQNKRTILFGEYYLAVLPCEVYLKALSETGDWKAYASPMASALKALGRYARGYPIGLPAYYFLKGHVSALKGGSKAATELWTRGAAEAHRWSMRFERGRLLLAQGRAAMLPGKDRLACAREAHDGFLRMGLPDYIREGESLMRELTHEGQGGSR